MGSSKRRGVLSARRSRALTVYVLPARIQQGWGDLMEMARACQHLRKAGFRLVYLSQKGASSRAPERWDARALPFDPRTAPWLGFPPLERRGTPVRGGPAALLVTWWGVTARRQDSMGGKMPATHVPEVEAIREAHRGYPILSVSLEEFAFSQSSRMQAEEALRQAGWTSSATVHRMNSPEGRHRQERYHAAFVAARGGDCGEVLHLVSTFAANRAGVKEFPFLIEIGPYGLPNRPPPVPASPRRRTRTLLWYVSGEGSLRVWSSVQEVLGRERGLPWELQIRADPAAEHVLRARSSSAGPRPQFLSPAGDRAWKQRLSNADLLLVGGGQSLVDAVAVRRPFLYFHGSYGGLGRSSSRAFRREILLTLVAAMASRGVDPPVRKDLLDFADGRRQPAILRRALESAPWRRAFLEFYRRGGWPPVALPKPRSLGGRYLVDVLRQFARYRGTTESFVQARRKEAGSCYLP